MCVGNNMGYAKKMLNRLSFMNNGLPVVHKAGKFGRECAKKEGHIIFKINEKLVTCPDCRADTITCCIKRDLLNHKVGPKGEDLSRFSADFVKYEEIICVTRDRMKLFKFRIFDNRKIVFEYYIPETNVIWVKNLETFAWFITNRFYYG